MEAWGLSPTKSWQEKSGFSPGASGCPVPGTDQTNAHSRSAGGAIVVGPARSAAQCRERRGKNPQVLEGRLNVDRAQPTKVHRRALTFFLRRLLQCERRTRSDLKWRAGRQCPTQKPPADGFVGA